MNFDCQMICFVAGENLFAKNGWLVKKIILPNIFLGQKKDAAGKQQQQQHSLLKKLFDVTIMR